MLELFLFTLLCQQPLPRIEVHDDLVVRESCVLVCSTPVEDAGKPGIVHIVGSGIEVRFEGELLQKLRRPEETTGIGLLVEAENVTLVAPRLAGFHTGIWAREADGLSIEGGAVRRGFRQRLGSTFEREDSSDWLRPHENDRGQWRANYGAALCVERCSDVSIAGLSVRTCQNGILLDRVTEARVLGCDASYLSGWGLGMWRSSRNLVENNRFDFCIRGYSHGRYNRGQDSAGILLFEQCCDNVFRRNSATHGGDGIFGFGGREALGEGLVEGEAWAPAETGCNRNLFEFNDLSFAAAHGFELTFSHGNVVRHNLMEGNAICGAWYGYGRDSIFEDNLFLGNGEAGYGSERGGLNAEHGQGLVVRRNRFSGNAIDLRFWTDPDEHLAGTPWALRFGQGAGDIDLIGNALEAGVEAVGLVDDLRVDARIDVDKLLALEPDGTDRLVLVEEPEGAGRRAFGQDWLAGLPDRRTPGGREAILVTDLGPYDGRSSLVRPLERSGAVHRYQVLGDPQSCTPSVVDPSLLDLNVLRDATRWSAGSRQPEGEGPGLFEIVPIQADVPGVEGLASRAPGPLDQALAYRVTFVTYAAREGLSLHAFEGLLLPMTWDVVHFGWTVDPREDVAGWRAEARDAASSTCEELVFPFGGGGPSRAGGADLPADRFGTIATSSLRFPAGTYRIQTLSDDGIRVAVDGETVIEDWTHHGPTRHAATFAVESFREVTFLVEHFELDGHAVLEVRVDRVSE